MQYIRDIDKEEIRSTAYHDAAGDLKFDPAVFGKLNKLLIN